MSKSVLVLEENPAIQGLIASSLPPDLLSLHQESDPESFLQQARSLKPDLIFVSNEDRSRGYDTLRQIREDRDLSSTPLVLLVNARDRLDHEVMTELGVEDQVRKPFEADNLREQVRKHLLENLPSALDPEEEEALSNTESNPLFDEEMMSLISEAPGVAEDEVEVPEIDFAADLDDTSNEQEDDSELDDLSLSDLPELAAEAKALMQGLAPDAEPPYDDALEADEFGAHDTFFEDLPEPAQIMEASPAPTPPKATEDSKGSRMTEKTSASANDEADLQLDEEISANDGEFQSDDDFILDEELELDEEVEAEGSAVASAPAEPDPEPESDLGALGRLKESGLEDQLARSQGASNEGAFAGAEPSWGDAASADGSFFESSLEDHHDASEAGMAADSASLEMGLESLEDNETEDLSATEDDLSDAFVDLDLNEDPKTLGAAGSEQSGDNEGTGLIAQAKKELIAEETALLEDAEQLEEAVEVLEAEEAAVVEEAGFLEEAEAELEAEKSVLIEKAEALEEVEEVLEAKKEKLIEKAALIEQTEADFEAAKGVMTKEQTDVFEAELEAEEEALAEEIELLGEAEDELKAEEAELLVEAELLEEAEEEIKAEEAALVKEVEQIEAAKVELRAEEAAVLEEAELLEEVQGVLEAEEEILAEEAESPDETEPDLEAAEIEDFEENLDELEIPDSPDPAALEASGSGGGGSGSGASAKAAEMDSVLLDLTPEDKAHPPQDPGDQVILADTVEHVVEGPLTSEDDLDSFMESSSLEEMESDEVLESVGEEEERLIAEEVEVVEALGEEEMLGEDDLAELQSLDEEMAALEEQEVEALSELETLPEEEESAPGTFVETPDEDLATWEQAEGHVREFARETFQEVLDEDEPAEEEAPADEVSWETAEATAELLEESAHQLADEVSQEEQTFANWEEAEDEFIQHDRYAESPELQLAGFGSESSEERLAAMPKGDLEEIISRLVSESVEKTLQANMPRGALEAAVESLVQRSVAQALDEATPKIIEQIIQGVRDQSN